MLSDVNSGSISRTVQYKKITKPLLERKRRARINRCLDELKELMVDALEAEGENISKLEKADILELTVRHLHRLHKPRDPIEDAQRFQAGFGRCAAEACQFLLSIPGIDTRVGQNLVRHLGSCVNSVVPLSIQVPNQQRFSPPLSPATPITPLTPSTIRPRITINTNASNRQYNNQEILSSTPSVHDLAKPMTGLLMQVPKSANREQQHQNARGVLRNVILERQSKAQNKKKLEDKMKKDFGSFCRQDEESDVEIDIEKVDDKDMWRPW